MKITVFDGTPQSGFEAFQTNLNEYLSSDWFKDHVVQRFSLRDMNLSFCTGCFNCWWKNPGRCSINDDIEILSTAFVNSEHVIFAAPLIYGFPSSLLKKVQDRLIPILLPYIELVNNECHHSKRYDNYPVLEIFFGNEPDTNKEEQEIVTDIYKRLTLNFHSKLVKVQFKD